MLRGALGGCTKAKHRTDNLELRECRCGRGGVPWARPWTGIIRAGRADQSEGGARPASLQHRLHTYLRRRHLLVAAWYFSPPYQQRCRFSLTLSGQGSKRRITALVPPSPHLSFQGPGGIAATLQGAHRPSSSLDNRGGLDGVAFREMCETDFIILCRGHNTRHCLIKNALCVCV